MYVIKWLDSLINEVVQLCLAVFFYFADYRCNCILLLGVRLIYTVIINL